MVTNKTNFVILFQERSGSSFLASLLDQHPEISCLHEHLPMVSRLLSKQEISKRLSQIYDQPEKRARGFKFKDVQMLAYPEALMYLRKMKDLRVIFLDRKNHLKGAISVMNHRNLLKKYHISNLMITSEIVFSMCELDLDRLVELTQLRITCQKQLKAVAESFDKCITIDYEDLLNDTPSTLRKICNFLHVDFFDKPPTPILKKYTPDSLEKVLSNYEELKERISGTPLEEYLYT